MPRPDVTVVIPARNEEALIAGALQSVAGQDWPLEQLEVVVAVNATADRTAEVAAAAGRAARLSLRIVTAPQAGVAAAKNRGAAAGSGRTVLFIDADSRMSPGLVRRVVERQIAGERAASIRIRADSSDRVDRAFFGLLELGKRLFGIRANMFACDRELFLRLGGFDEDLRHAEDLEFLRRVARDGTRIGHIREEWIATSPRRLHQGPLRAGMFRMFGRWTLGHFGIGRRWPY
jgi:glycosyltransferase involved in cell wall biosynthesis